MRQWIARLFACDELDLACVKTFACDGLLVRLRRDCRHCAHPAYVIELLGHTDSDDAWHPIAVLAGRNLHTAAALLTRAAQYVDAEGVKQFAPSFEDD